MRVRRATAAGLAFLGLAGGVGVVAFPGAAAATSPYDGTAAAYGFDSTISNSSIPLGLVIQGAGPVAQAHLDSLQNSDAFASFPYPGDVIAGVPGVAGVLFGGLPFPAYPVIVTTQAGDPPKTADGPGIALSAQSENQSSQAKAVVGSDAIGATSIARVTYDAADGLLSHAETAVKGLDLFNFLRISGVQSIAEARRDAGGELATLSTTSINRISAPGLAVTLPPTSPGCVPFPNPIPGTPQAPPTCFPQVPFPLGGQTLEEPNIGFQNGNFNITTGPPGQSSTFPVPMSVIQEAFRAQGVEVAYQAEQKTKDGVIAPVVSFTYDAPPLPDNDYYQGPTTFTVSFGRASASASLIPTIDDFVAPTLPGSFGTQAGALLPGVDAAAVPGLGGLPSTGGFAGVPQFPNSPVAGIDSPGPPEVRTVSLANHAFTGPDGTNVYTAFLLIAGVGFVALTGWRVLGVRFPWGT